MSHHMHFRDSHSAPVSPFPLAESARPQVRVFILVFINTQKTSPGPPIAA